MDPTSVAPGIWRITVPLPYRPRTVHAYLVDGGGGALALVDGGANTDAAWEALDLAVRLLGTGWPAIGVHVITHMHTDHIGLAGRIRSACGAPLAMGRLDAERAEHAAAHPEEEAIYRKSLLTRAGADPELIAWSAEVRARGEHHVPCDHPLPEPTAAVPGLEGWTAVWTPGHTAGHISLFRAADRVLIGGDAVLPRISPTLGVNRQREDAVGDYLEAMERLQALAPTVILPGHGDPIAEPNARLEELNQETRRESERVFALLGSHPRTAAEVAADRYAGRPLPSSQRVQAIRETLAHLRHLQALGLVTAEEGAELVRFSPI